MMRKSYFMLVLQEKEELYISSILSNNATEMKISPFVYAIKETIKPDKSAM